MSAGSPFVKDEGGFTTPAAAIAILLVCALLFMCVDGYRVGSRSGQIQYVADAGALAADGAVADFVTAGQVVDAVLLSLSLLGVTVYAVSAVAAFVPGGAAVAARLATAGEKVIRARDSFAKSAIKGLNAAQKALPALCATRAAQVVRANARASGQDYVGIAFANPVRGVRAELADGSAVREATEQIAAEEEEVQKKARAQRQAQEKLDAAKERAWRADCGPGGMSMRERAGHLAGLAGPQNPSYATSDNWRFSVPLARATAYYRARLAQEPGELAGGPPEKVGESIARKRFYRYALQTVSRGRVARASAGGEVPDLRELPRNTRQIRETPLYAEAAYPVSKHGEKLVLHAWSGCPGYAKGAPAGMGSVAEIEHGGLKRCDRCKFAASTLGRVPAASTSIDNGFEYHYRIVVEASRRYSEAAREVRHLRGELSTSRKKMARGIKKALESLRGQRYDPQPPGRYGCVCLVVAPPREEPGLPFLSDGSRIPARVAISGATLAPDAASDQGTVVSGVAEGLVPSSGAGSGAVRIVWRAWGTALKAYADGNDAVVGMFDALLSKVPLVGTELSDWAAKSFRGAIEGVGLEPADLKTHKPVLVNTSQVTSRGAGEVGRVLERLKNAGELYAAGEVGDLAAAVELLPDCPELSGTLSEAGLVVAQLALPGGGTRGGAVTVPAPSDLPAQYAAALGDFGVSAGGG